MLVRACVGYTPKLKIALLGLSLGFLGMFFLSVLLATQAHAIEIRKPQTVQLKNQLRADLVSEIKRPSRPIAVHRDVDVRRAEVNNPMRLNTGFNPAIQTRKVGAGSGTFANRTGSSYGYGVTTRTASTTSGSSGATSSSSSSGGTAVATTTTTTTSSSGGGGGGGGGHSGGGNVGGVGKASNNSDGGGGPGDMLN